MMFWHESGWVKDWRAARHFTAPPLREPHLECFRVCQLLARADGPTGPGYVPAFFARPEIRRFKPQRRRGRLADDENERQRVAAVEIDADVDIAIHQVDDLDAQPDRINDER